MYLDQEYLYGWLAYLAGVVVLFACVWYVTRFMRGSPLRRLVLLLMTVTLIVPWTADPDLHYLAPAWIIAGSEALFDDASAFWRAGLPLVVVQLGALILSACAEIMLYSKRKPSKKKRADKQQAKTSKTDKASSRHAASL